MERNNIIYKFRIILVLIIVQVYANFKPAHAVNNQVDIVISANAAIQETKAANQLSLYLKEIYPTYRFSVTTVMNENNLNVRMGLPAFVSSGEQLKGIPSQEEGFLIHRLNEKNVVILSRSVKGLFNAVYSLLEKLGYGFYLSYDVKALPKKELNFNEWEMSDYPLQSERIVFNWHNFISGCTGWNYEDWCAWIDQSAKMRYNTIMVHAYGNNPMFSFEYNGQKKNVGYLTTSQSGRDWGAEHVNDIRRLPGGKVLTVPVLGSAAAMVPDKQRGDAATKLMAKVFEHASEMAMKINFALDVDTWPANPGNIIETLPQDCKIKLKEQDIVNPDTEAGYLYYKAQVKKLLTDYPQISTITPWVRSETSNGSIWTRIKPSDFPKPWLKEWEQMTANHPEMEKYKFSAPMLAFSKIVKAYQKALKDIGRQDVTIAFGSWGWEFIPVAGLFMPENCPFIPLDRGNNLDPGEAKKYLKENGGKRKIIPILWAHDDDHQYIGRPFTPNANFNDLLKQCNAFGFGIIHWTTRPLDLFFKSLVDQVWSTSQNKSIASTVSDYSRIVFGQQQGVMNEYQKEWIENGPMFGRETTDHFFDLPNKKPLIKDEPTNTTIERIKSRIVLLKKADPSKMPEFGRNMFDYDYGSEIFYLSMYQNQDKFWEAYVMLERQSIDSAKAILQTVSPEKTIELYSDASAKLPITAGEKALIVSMGTRWLPDFINLKQRARMVDIRYKFGATQHDSLAQQPGSFTYFIDMDKNYWSCLGEKELKVGNAGRFDDTEAVKYPESSGTYIKVTAPFTVLLATIGKNQLAPGKYQVELKYKPTAGGSECKLYLTGKNSNIPLKTALQNSGQGLDVISSIIEIKDTQKYSIEVNPESGSKLFTNLVIKPM